MANLRLLKNRIKSVKSTAKITKTMQMVAASKMQKAQEKALAAMPYTEGITQIVGRLSKAVEGTKTIYFRQAKQPKTVGLILIAPSRGFCGALPTSLFLKANEFAEEMEKRRLEIQIISVQKLAHKIAEKLNKEITAHFADIPEFPEVQSLLPLLTLVKEKFREQEFDEVYIIYPHFVSTMLQEPKVEKVLPVSFEQIAEEERPESEGSTEDFIFEPTQNKILNALIPEYIEMQIFKAVLETKASEQSARMVVMKNATDNAQEMIEDLTLNYNKERQTSITNEMLTTAGRV